MDANKRTDPAAIGQHPYGLWASLGWYLVAEAAQRILGFTVNATGLQAVLDRNYLSHSLDIIANWGIFLAVFVVAVRLRHLTLFEYFGLVRPRMRDVILGIAIIVGLYVVLGTLIFFTDNYAAAVDEYRSAIAAGTSPWWFVLQWWPTFLLSPTIEEIAYRGFLWWGIQFHFGHWAAFVITTLIFVAAHYGYWLIDGGVNWFTVAQYLFASSIFGALRWRSGGTIVPMVAHSLDNAGLKITQVVLSAFAP